MQGDEFMRKTFAAAGGAIALTALLAGCSAGSVSADEAATLAEDQLEEQVGQRPDITCPEDLPAEVDASIECELTAEDMDETYPVTLTVTDVDGSNVGFDIQVAEEPMG